MQINYEKTRTVKEQNYIEIEDVKKCFLQGQNQYNGMTEYLGVYASKKYEVVIEIQNRENKTISLNYGDKNEFYDGYIIKFLEKHKNVKEITRKAFRSELDYILEILREEVI